MPRQTITIRLDGVTAGDYIAYVCDPEPPALGFGLTSVTIRAEPLGDLVEAILNWEDTVPQPRVAAAAAGLPVTDEVIEVRAAEIQSIPAPALPEVRHVSRITSMIDRAAARMASHAWSPSVAPPLQLRWA